MEKSYLPFHYLLPRSGENFKWVKISPTVAQDIPGSIPFFG